YGDRFVEHLNGQFAIALWDRTRRALVLARDRTGIRPLFHARAKGRLWFASETKALLAVLHECAAIDPLALAQALTYWSTPEPGTIHRGIQSLPPGCLLAIEHDGSETLTRYWDWTFPDAADTTPARYHGDIESATAELRAVLVDGVRVQWRSVVLFGALFGGGLDSSGIVSLVPGFSNPPVRTFSVADDGPGSDDSACLQAMAAQRGTDPSTRRCRLRQICEAYPHQV